MYAKLTAAMIGLVLTSTAAAMSLTDNATARQISAGSQTIAALSERCNTQHWPAFSANCLQTIDGKPWQRNFRVVAQY